MNYLNDNKLLHEKQSGFRAGHSTESAFILLIDSWLKAINDGKFVGCVMIDFRKAFDLVDHAVLLKKLEIYKCGKSALSWFKSYLSTRTQTVSIKHSKSDTENITCGVPQGSILVFILSYFKVLRFVMQLVCICYYTGIICLFVV